MASEDRQNAAEHEDPQDDPVFEELVRSLQSTKKPPMPTIREIALMRLREAGNEGSRAKTIREYIEATYGVEIHDKTVGMTLYRLLKDNLVRRDGHVWFIAPQDADTKNPGVGAPGSVVEGR